MTSILIIEKDYPIQNQINYYTVECCNSYPNPIRITNNDTSLDELYTNLYKETKILISKHFIKYLNNLMYPLDMNPDIELYTQSPFLKKQLTLEQTNIIMKCVEKENKNPDLKIKDIPVINRLTIIVEPPQSGKSFIPLEMSSHLLSRDNVIQTTLLVVPNLNISFWKTKLPFIYNEKYLIIDEIDILNSLLIDLDESFEDTDELIDTRNKYELTTLKKFNTELIKENKLIIISSELFDIFQYYSEITKLVFARLFYDSIFNINNVHSLFDDTYIYIYLMTNNKTILPIYENKIAYNNINNNYISENHGTLTMYLRFFKKLFIKTEFENEIKQLKITIEKKTKTLSKLKTKSDIDDLFCKSIEIDKSKIIEFENRIIDAENTIKECILYNKTQSKIKYLDTINYELKLHKETLNKNKYLQNFNTLTYKYFKNYYYMNVIKYNLLHKIKYKSLKNKICKTETNHVSIITRIEGSNKCPICLDTIECPLITKCCYNVFCLYCYMESNNTLEQEDTCPYCRKNIKIQKHYILENAIPKPYFDFNIIKSNINNIGIYYTFHLIFKYIKYKLENPKIIIIYDNNSSLMNIILEFIFNHNEISHIYYNDFKTLEDFSKTSLYDCIIMSGNSYIELIEMGYTFTCLDYVINYNSDLILNAHSLPRIIKRNKIKDNVTISIDLQSM